MTALYPNISTQLQLKYAGNEAGYFNYPQTKQTVNAFIEQHKEKTILSFELQYPGLEKTISVVHDLSSRQLDLDHFISEERLIEIAEDDFLLKGNYCLFLPEGGFESWDFAARIHGSLDKEHLRFISCPVMKPLTK